MTSIANFAPLCASTGHSAMPTRPHFGACRALRRRETTKHNAFQRQPAQPALRSRLSAEGPWFGGDTSGVLAFLRIGLYANGAPEGALFDLRRPGSAIGLSHPGRPGCASCSEWLPPTTNHHVIVISGSRFSHIIGQGCTNSVLPVGLVISYAIIITFICGVHCVLIVALRFSNLLVVFSPRFTGRSPKRSESRS
jgi:hypothetical protein